MKIRIKGNSIRFRLTQSETVKFDAGETIEERIEFGTQENQRLSFSLISEPPAEEISADHKSSQISVIVPREIVRDWVQSEQIGISHQQFLSAEKTLQILIEKDFTCLVPRTSGDDQDTFPHPKESEKLESEK